MGFLIKNYQSMIFMVVNKFEFSNQNKLFFHHFCPTNVGLFVFANLIALIALRNEVKIISQP